MPADLYSVLQVKLKETDFVIPGPSIEPPAKTPIGNVGMAICYDLRFPEMSLMLRSQGMYHSDKIIIL